MRTFLKDVFDFAVVIAVIAAFFVIITAIIPAVAGPKAMTQLVKYDQAHLHDYN